MIRHATDSDFEHITAIRKPYLLDTERVIESSYRFQMQESGFIGSLTKVEFREDLHHLFLVDEDETGITGYLRVDQDREYKDNDKKIWFSDDAKESYMSGSHAEIGMIGTREDKKRQGIAGTLLEEATLLLRSKNIVYLFSILVVSPLTNVPSLMFHEKHNFERIAISIPHYHFDLHNYQSFHYRKSL